jgi:hypothetical protein
MGQQLGNMSAPAPLSRLMGQQLTAAAEYNHFKGDRAWNRCLIQKEEIESDQTDD